MILSLELITTGKRKKKKSKPTQELSQYT